MAKRRGNNEGSITKRKDGRWQGYVTVGYDVETERPKKKYFYGRTRKEVAEKVNEALGKVSGGSYKIPSRMTAAQWFNAWLNDYMKPSLRSTTWESYRTQIDKHILPAMGHLQLAQVQTSHLQRLYNEKLAGGRADGKKKCEGCGELAGRKNITTCKNCGGKLLAIGLSPRSVKYIHIVIHGALEQAKKEGMITVNPADAVKLPAETRKEVKVLDVADVSIFLANAKETKYFSLYYLALSTGLRRGELLGLRWQDIDFNNKQLSVNQGLVRTKEGLVFQEPKTKLSKRTINLSDDVIQELTLHKENQEAQKKEAGEAYNEALDLVFCNELGEPICPRNLTRCFERLLKKAGLEGAVSFHGLRHSFATLSLQEGVDIRTTQETLGHHSAAFTLDTYSSVTAKMKKEATDKVSNLLTSCMNKNTAS